MSRTAEAHERAAPRTELEFLQRYCAGGFRFVVNHHLVEYRTVNERLREFAAVDVEISPEIQERIRSTGQLVEVCCYPHSTVGHLLVVHHNIARALEAAMCAVAVERCPAVQPWLRRHADGLLQYASTPDMLHATMEKLQRREAMDGVARLCTACGLCGVCHAAHGSDGLHVGYGECPTKEQT